MAPVVKLGCLLTLWLAAVAADPVCRDEDGSPVDWFAAIKVPRLHDVPQKDYQYFILTSKNKNWRLTQYGVNEQNGAIYNTANQAYSLADDDSAVAIAYNDERPPEFHDAWRQAYWPKTGHMKGVLAFAANGSGFWLIDSVPKFPGRSSYIYPDTGFKYGQHFFCVTFGYNQLPTIAKQLVLADPIVFFSHLPHAIGDKIPDLQTLVNNDWPELDPTYSVASLQSSAGAKFLHFSKSPKFGKDLYDSFVAPGLKTSLLMEGWIDGRGDLNSSCNTPYHVYNIHEVRLGENTWKTSEDHSKWVVSTESSAPWVCLGDINRQESQSRRGGGTLCHSDPSLWAAFHAMVKHYEPCPPDVNFGEVFKSKFDIL